MAISQKFQQNLRIQPTIFSKIAQVVYFSAIYELYAVRSFEVVNGTFGEKWTENEVGDFIESLPKLENSIFVKQISDCVFRC